MADVLKELKEISHMGCIDDRGEIAKILERVRGLTLGEISAMVDDDVGRYIRYTAEACLYDEHGLQEDESAVENLGLMELLCLVENTGLAIYTYSDPAGQKKNIQSQEETGVSKPYRYVGLWNLFCFFEEARKNNSLIRLLMAVEVNELLGYLDVKDFFKHEEEVCRKNFRDIRKRFGENAQALGIEWIPGQKICVEDLLNQAGKVRRTCWNPWYPIEIYRSQVLAAFELCRILLVECFKYAFPEEFRMEKILGKFKPYTDPIDDMDTYDIE